MCFQFARLRFRRQILSLRCMAWSVINTPLFFLLLNSTTINERRSNTMYRMYSEKAASFLSINQSIDAHHSFQSINQSINQSASFLSINQSINAYHSSGVFFFVIRSRHPRHFAGVLIIHTLITPGTWHDFWGKELSITMWYTLITGLAFNHVTWSAAKMAPWRTRIRSNCIGGKKNSFIAAD